MSIYAVSLDGYLREYSSSDLSTLLTSADYGTNLRAVAQDDDYVYIGGGTPQTVRRYTKTDFTFVDATASYGGEIHAIEVDDTHIYVAGLTTNTVRKYLKSDMSYVGQTASYGGSILHMKIDDTHIYAGGATTQTVRKYLKSDLSYIGQTDSAGDDINGLHLDADYVYYGYSNYFKRANKSDLGGVITSDTSITGEIYGITSDDSYVYASGSTPSSSFLRKMNKSDLTEITTSSGLSTGGVRLANDGTYLYSAGINNRVNRFLMSDMTYVDQSAAATGIIFDVAVRDDGITAVSPAIFAFGGV